MVGTTIVVLGFHSSFISMQLTYYGRASPHTRLECPGFVRPPSDVHPQEERGACIFGRNIISGKKGTASQVSRKEAPSILDEDIFPTATI